MRILLDKQSGLVVIYTSCPACGSASEGPEGLEGGASGAGSTDLENDTERSKTEARKAPERERESGQAKEQEAQKYKEERKKTVDSENELKRS